jgi:ribulose-5-phosphate 4-epimerase/fuculose-1-phosphate aldolase
MDQADAAVLVAKACRILGKLDLTHASLGHVSTRLDDEMMLIKGKGPGEVGLRYTRPEDIITVGFDAEKKSGPEGLRPPSESFLHSWLYKTNPRIKSVVHVHPEHAVLLTICRKEIIPIYGAFGPGARMAIDGVATYPRSVRIRSDALGAEFAAFMGDKQYVLMRGHGVSVTGASVEDATVRAIVLNELVTMTYKAYLLGDPQPISVEDIEDVSALGDPHQTRGSAGGEAGMLATWRYYSALVDET